MTSAREERHASVWPCEKSATTARPLRKVDLEGTLVLVIGDPAAGRHNLEGMLKGWSMQPTLVEGGQEGLEALRCAREMGKPFPLVLLDAHMPGLDGFRVVEELKSDPTLGESALMMLTPAGQRGDATRCRELGVSAYLVKPIRYLDLLETIQELVSGVPGIPTPAPAEKPPVEVLDEALLISRVDNDLQLLRDLVDLFLGDYPRLLDEIKAALERKDARALQGGAHSLKGCTSNLAARLASEAALELEGLAHTGDSVEAAAALQGLERELVRLKPALLAARADKEIIT